VGYGLAGVAAYYAAQWIGRPLWKQLLAGSGAMLVGCVLVFLVWPAFRRDVLSILDIRKLLGEAKRKR